MLRKWIWLCLLMDMVIKNEFYTGNAYLLIKEKNGFVSGQLDGPVGKIMFPPMRKDSSGVAMTKLDESNGIAIKLTLGDLAKLSLTGDFGVFKYRGRCSSTTKIDKAKSMCADIGFTAGTEKFGECVLKMMAD